MLPSRFSEKNYWEEDYSKHLTLSDVWNRNAMECPDEVAVSDSEKRLTWGKAKTWIDRMALGLIENNFNKTDILAVQLPNCIELNLIRVACERAGCLCMPLNPAFRGKDVEYSLKFVSAKGIVIPYEFGNFNYYEMIGEHSHNIESLRHILIVGDRVPDGAISVDSMIQEPIEKRHPEDWLERTKCKSMEFSTISMTTGTTGFPKFVERAICSHIDMSKEFAKKWKVTSKDVFAVFSPSSGGPNVAGYFVAPLMKARVAMLERFYSDKALELIETEKITIIAVVPTMLVKMIEDPNFNRYNLRSLRLIISIGSSIPYRVAKDAERMMGAPIIQRYGSVDSGFGSVTSPEDMQETRFLTVGKPVGNVEVNLLDDEGVPISNGETGEMVIRVKREFSGYFKDLKSTLQSWAGDGWFKMGDLGKWDDQGNLMIVGRKKEMIIRGGQNIYPIEIEEMMLSHEKVRETAIVGIPDQTMGQRVCVCVVPTSSKEVVTLEEIVDFLKKRGASSYKIPERLEVIEEMPMEPGGQKVDKKALRDNIVQRVNPEGIV